MNKYYLVTVVIIMVVIIAIQLWHTWRADKENTIILGNEWNAASKAEKNRIEAGGILTSPMPNFNYSKWSDEHSLIDPVENELDLKILELCTTFKTYNPDERKAARKSLSQNNIYTLLEFSKRVTLLGLRKNNPAYIENGLIAIGMIEAERCDYRDILMTLSFLDYGLQKSNLRHNSIIQESVNLSDGETKNLIEEFFQSDEKDRRIEVMAGYTAVETSKGISFIGTGYGKYDPKYNLAKILFNISEYVYRDKYLKGNIAIGEDIPLIWLSAENDKKIAKALSGIAGTAKLQTDLRNDFSKNSMQMLLVYLSEFNDDKSQQILLDQLGKTSPKTFKRISFAHDNIVCVIIQRATTVGSNDFESQESLKRFEKPIRALIQKGK